MDAAFQPLPPRPSAVSACADALRESILSGRIAPGSRLPPERTLAATLGVNRLTLRHALGQITAAGLVSVRQGSGYVVRNFVEEGGPDLIAPMLALASNAAGRRDAIDDILFVRRVLARAVLERLAKTIDEAGLARLGKAVEEFEAVILRKGSTPREMAKADQAAIRALVRETRSPVLALVVNPVLRVADALEPIEAIVYADPAVNAMGWRLLLATLDSHDAATLDEVVEAMEEMDARVHRALAPKKPKKKRTTRRTR